MQMGNATHPTLAATLWPAQGTLAALRWALLAILGSIFIALCSQIFVPTQPVPITMQTFAVLLIGAAYGWRLGAATVALYLLEGAVGLPVFAEMKAGYPVLLGPTGGYLVGFVFAAALVGWLAERRWDRNVILTGAAMILGNLVIYALGLAWLWKFVGDKVLELGLLPFLLGDALKIALAMAVLPAAWKIVTGLRR
jgi:biotin transport system substrate-specific component